MGRQVRVKRVAFSPLEGGERLDFYYVNFDLFIDCVVNRNNVKWSARIDNSTKTISLYREKDRLSAEILTKEKFKSDIIGVLRPSTRSYTPSELLFNENEWIREIMAALNWTGK